MLILVEVNGCAGWVGDGIEGGAGFAAGLVESLGRAAGGGIAAVSGAGVSL